MRLTLKLALIFILANIALAGIYGYLAVRREDNLFRDRATAEAKEMGHIIEKLLADAWLIEGDRDIRESFLGSIVSRQQPLHIRWVWFDAKAEAEFRPAVPCERLTAVVIQEHNPIEADEPDGNSYLHIYWSVTLPSTPRRAGVRPSHDRIASQQARDRPADRGAHRRHALDQRAFSRAVRGSPCRRPLEQLIAKARRIGGGDLEGPLHLRSRDELAELAENLNTMCANLTESQVRLRQETDARITALEQLRHADRLKTVGRLASGIAHELGTPLNVVAGRAGLIGSGKLDAEQIGESATAIKLEADKMTAIIRQLLDFARAGASKCLSSPRRRPPDDRHARFDRREAEGPHALRAREKRPWPRSTPGKSSRS